MRRTAFSILLLVAAVCAEAREPIQRDEDDLRILQVIMDGEVLTTEMTAYEGPGKRIVLPLGQTAAVLGLAITIRPDLGTADGFVVRKERTFVLDAVRHRLSLGGKTVVFDPALVEVHQDDIYVESKLLSQWLEIDLQVDVMLMSLTARPREPLPSQSRRLREARMANAKLRTSDPDFPLWKNPYQPVGTPFVDMVASLAYRSGGLQASYATYATGDFLGMQSEWYVRGDRGDRVQDGRFTLSRRDDRAGLLGRLHAREVLAGSLSSPGTSLISSSSVPSLGLLVSNYPLERPTHVTSHSFYGNLPVGWDIELFQNGMWTDYRQAGEDGQYAFENVPLTVGSNVIELISHGPYGQRRVETHRFTVGSSMTPPGRVYYRLALNRERAGIGLNLQGSESGYRALAQFDVGIRKWLSGVVETATLPLADGQHHYAKAGIRASLKALFVQVDRVQDQRGHSATEVGFQTRLLGIGISGHHVDVGPGYVSALFPSSVDPLVRRDRLRLEGAIRWNVTQIPLSLDAEHDELASGRTRSRLRSRASAHYRWLAASNELSWVRTREDPAQIEGTLQLNSLSHYGLYGELLYRLDGQPRLSAMSLSTEGSITPIYRYSAGVLHSTSGGTQLTLGLNKIFGAFAAGVQTRYDTRLGTFETRLDVSLGAMLEPRNNHLTIDARPLAAMGAASIRSFLDRNLNGKWDSGEEPIANVAFTVNGDQAAVVTGKDGIALITQLPVNRPLNVGLAVRSLEDPAWVPRLAGVQFVARPGKTFQVDFPVVLTGEIDGTVRLAGNATSRPAGGLTLELVSRSGTVQETKSAYDGYFVFAAVVPGEYELRIAAADLNRLGVAAPPSQIVRIGAEGKTLTGVDFALGTRPAPRPPAAPADPRDVPTVAAIGDSTPPTGRTSRSSPELEDVAVLRNTKASWAVQVGAYRRIENATAMGRRIGKLQQRSFVRRQGDLHLVMIGPFATKEAAVLSSERLSVARVDSMVVALH